MLRRLGLPLLAGAIVATVILVAWPAEDPARPTARSGAPPPGRAVFAELGCGSCHRLKAAGTTGQLAPDLDERLPDHTPESLRAVILDPPDGMMPQDFGERTTDAELDALVEFLLSGR
jgi:mono/diheme cytochrome c family protein